MAKRYARDFINYVSDADEQVITDFKRWRQVLKMNPDNDSDLEAVLDMSEFIDYRKKMEVITVCDKPLQDNIKIVTFLAEIAKYAE